MGVVFRTKYQIHILEIVMADFSMNTSTASKLFCRICHDEGNLQHPCQCAGTIGLVHLKCLETWFSINGKNNCELCGHLFQVIKKDRSFKEWILTEGSDVSKRYVIFDVIAFILLTPLLIFSFTMCVAIFILLLYILWLYLLFTHHRSEFKDWQKKNQTTKIIRSEEFGMYKVKRESAIEEV